MGSWDRDYMRERARARARRPKGLEALLEIPFKLQSRAIMLMLLGYLLASRLPMSIIRSFAPNGPIVMDPSTMYMDMTSRGFLGAAATFLPIVRLLGLLLVGVSGWALIQRRKHYGYSDVIADARIGILIAIVGFGFVTSSIWNDGFWKKQTSASGRMASEIATGVRRSDQETRIPQVRAPVTSTRPAMARPVEIELSNPDLTPDRPFPANGTMTRTLPLAGKTSTMSFQNTGSNNAIVMWFYNLGDDTGDKEALRLYVTAGQSSIVRLPSFDYRMAIYEASPRLGLDRGFGPDAQMKDLGFIDLKTPDTMLSRTPSATYHPYVGMQFRPGVYKAP